VVLWVKQGEQSETGPQTPERAREALPRGIANRRSSVPDGAQRPVQTPVALKVSIFLRRPACALQKGLEAVGKPNRDLGGELR